MVLQDDPSFDEFFDAIRQITVILDAYGRVVKANNTALGLFGKSRDEIVNRPLWGLPGIADSRKTRNILKHAINQAAKGQFIRQELVLHQRNKPERFLDFSLQPFFDERGNLQFILAEGRDITLHRRTSEALFQSEARFQSVYEKSAMGILIKGVDGKLRDCNPAFQSMLGFSAEEMLDMDYLAITYPLDRKISQKLFTELIAGKRKNYSIEKRYLSKAGAMIWARVTLSLVESSGGQPQFVIAMVENITTQKQIEDEMSELRLRLMQGREMERLQIAQDLHDGPLQEIIAMSYQLQALKNPYQGDPDLEQLQNIYESTQKLANSIRSICGELRPPTLIPFGVEKAIRSHAEDVRKSHPELQIDVDLIDGSPELPEQTRIAVFRIYQEAINNVLRHAHASHVNVRLWLEEEQVFLEVSDDGVGFDLPIRWIKLARQGHLGLVGAQERAQEIGGDLEVKTAPGQGTLVRAIIPLNIALGLYAGE